MSDGRKQKVRASLLATVEYEIDLDTDSYNTFDTFAQAMEYDAETFNENIYMFIETDGVIWTVSVDPVAQ